MSNAAISQSGAWARATLYGGVSSLPVWAIDGSAREVRVSIGTDPACDWTVTAPGVAPLHLELYWDGYALWVGSAVGASLDGQTIASWTKVEGPGQIEFGSAMLEVEVGSEETGRTASILSRMPLQSEATVIVADMAQLAPPSIRSAGFQQPMGSPPEAAAFASRTPPPQSVFRAPPDSKTKKSNASLPPRTWALLGAVAVAFTFVLLMGDEAPAAGAKPRADRASEVQEAAVADAPAKSSPVTTVGASKAAVAPETDEGEEEAETSPTRTTEDSEAGKPAEVDGKAAEAPPRDDGRITEKEAAALLTEGKYEEAIAAYDELAATYPGEEVFPAMKSILARRIALDCKEGDGKCAK